MKRIILANLNGHKLSFLLKLSAVTRPKRIERLFSTQITPQQITLSNCLFWVVYHPSRTYLPKEAWVGAVNRSFSLSPPPNHTPLYLLPLAHGPTMSYIGWVQAGGAWALRVLPFQICPRVCLLLMCLPQPGDSPSAFPGLSCGLSFGFSLHSGARPRMIMGFTFLWPTFGFLHCLAR